MLRPIPGDRTNWVHADKSPWRVHPDPWHDYTHTFAYTHPCSTSILSKVVGARVIIYICHCLSDGTMDSWTPAMVDVEDMMGPFVIFLSGFLGCYGGGDGLGRGKRWGVLIFTSNFAIETAGRRSYCTCCCQHLFDNFVQLYSPAFAE